MKEKNVVQTVFDDKIKAHEALWAPQVAQDTWALSHHLMPVCGWLNDPNGLCYYNGKYHVFFQYSPLDVLGGDKFWGHYQSSDFIHWEYTGVPLAPDTPLDKDGVYSGSALVIDGIMHLYYTGNTKEEGDFDYIHEGRGSCTLHTTTKDGICCTKKNCLLSMEDYPGYATQHVRDPKVFFEDNMYYILLGARDRNDTGFAMLYVSKDGREFSHLKDFYTPEPFGYMWECPDLFHLDKETYLSISPQGVNACSHQYQNVYQSGYFSMEGDYRKDCTLLSFHEWDMGFDFYAPQTFLDAEGRRILIGWMGLPEECGYTNPTVSHGWQHALTIPRVLTKSPKNHLILQNPVEEMESLRTASHQMTDCIPCTPSSTFEFLMEDIHSKDTSVRISKGLLFQYHAAAQECTLSFQDDSFIGYGRKCRKSILPALHSLRIFVDTSAVEIYINDGEQVFTTRYYPDSSFTIEYHCGCVEAKALYWELAPMEIINRFL